MIKASALQLQLCSEFQPILGYSVRSCIEGEKRRGERERSRENENILLSIIYPQIYVFI